MAIITPGVMVVWVDGENFLGGCPDNPSRSHWPTPNIVQIMLNMMPHPPSSSDSFDTTQGLTLCSQLITAARS
jgi:hypothetical protein